MYFPVISDCHMIISDTKTVNAEEQNVKLLRDNW